MPNPEESEICTAEIPGLSTTAVSCTCDPCGDDCTCDDDWDE